MHPLPGLTVLIPCKNERVHIRACIESARGLADEILVADSGSTDGTQQIVHTLGGCRLIERDWNGYANFKNWALEQAQHEWVFILDADERITPQLAAEMRSLLAGMPRHAAYRLCRQNYFLGRPIRYCGWRTTTVTRLLRRDVCRYRQRRVHEDIDLPEDRVGWLQAKLLHYTADALDPFIEKQVRYSALAAADLIDRRVRPRYLGVLLHAPWRFFQLYILRGGILDGFPGLVLCMLMSFYVFLKDARVWAEGQPSAPESPRIDLELVLPRGAA